MKNKTLTPLLLFSASLLIACGGNNNQPASSETASDSDVSESATEGSSSSEPIETYDVIFKDGDTVIKDYLDQTPGTYVDVPQLEGKERYELTGWTGLSDKAFKEHKVRVYESDQTYSTIWVEQFGTDNVYTATSLTSTSSITVDGTKDDAYGDATKIDIASSNCAAKAEAYVTYDTNNLYVFVEVEDSTKHGFKQSGQNINSCDSLTLFLDLMHDDSLATTPYNGGWGENYRGASAMVEGVFNICRGFEASEEKRFDKDGGSDFAELGWLSNAAKEDGCTTVGTTHETEKGYNVEYRIDLTNSNVPNEYKPKAGNKFGLGIVLYDQTTDEYNTGDAVSSRCGIEELNLLAFDGGPKKLSNFEYKQNSKEDRVGVEAIKVRDCYSVTSDNSRDKLFKDATPFTVAGSTFEILYDNDKYYLYVDKGTNSPSLKVTFDNVSDEFSVDADKKISVPNDKKYFQVSYKEGEEAKTEKFFIVNTPNKNNLASARKLYTTKYTTETITIDGKLDDVYDKSVKFDVNSKSLTEKGNLEATGVAYSMFDDDYLYVFVDVADSHVDSTTVNEGNPEQNDSVELWISTTQTLPTSTTVWGTENRPDASYCGEGCFRLRAGMDNGLSGGHWLYDDSAKCPREAVSKLTSTGYTAEYKIGWASFRDSVKNGEIIDIMVTINDGENNTAGTRDRHGVVCSNLEGHNAYLKPYYLDHIQLAGK